MAKAIALTRDAFETAQLRRVELARSIIVIACGASLIFAGQALPF